jgi:ADP-ribose pyrophosphatase YjhB (NUDIX family)
MNEPEVGRTRVAAYALATDDQGRILLCRVAPWVLPKPVWLLPGGGLHFGEAPEVAVIRELEEESGPTGEVERLLDVSDRTHPAAADREGFHAIRIVYRVRITGGELRDEADGSTDTCGWFTLEEARALELAELVQRTLASLLSGPAGG